VTDRETLPTHPLRIGMMVNSLTCPAWVAKIVNDIQSSSFAEIVLIIRNDAPVTGARKSLRQRLKTYWTHSLFERYRRWDRNHHRQELDAFAETDLAATLAGVPVVSAQPLQKGFVDRFAPEDIVQIRDANLDVLFRFGFRIIRGEILSCAKFGVWSFHHGDNREYRGAPPGFWEMYEGNVVTGSILQLLTEALDGGRVIYRSLSATNFDSLYLSLNPLYWKTAAFALRRLRDLHIRGWDYLTALEEFKEQDSYKKGIYRTPGTPVMMKFLTRLLLRRLRKSVLWRLFQERTEWFIAFRPRVGPRTVLNDLTGFRAVVPPRGRFYADPSIVKADNKTYLFLEDFDFSKNRALISCAEIQKDEVIGRPFNVLEKNYHLSYPFVFRYRDQTYMIPETRERDTIELYRAVDFPAKWEFLKFLAQNIRAVDSTIFANQGKLWLFANVAEPGASTFDELHLFLADSLEGNWSSHPKNPIVSDVRRARPAGALFVEGGKLIRPSQDCSLRYGAALVLNEVKTLSETDYWEAPFSRIEPGWHVGSICTHTYNRTDEFEVLDGMRLKRTFRLFAS
jgi:hypothetical protein